MLLKALDSKTSRIRTGDIFLLGTSTPMAAFPGIGALFLHQKPQI